MKVQIVDNFGNTYQIYGDLEQAYSDDPTWPDDVGREIEKTFIRLKNAEQEYLLNEKKA